MTTSDEGGREPPVVTDARAAEALRWIVGVFDRTRTRHQAVGGLAARAYGARRPLVDLDFYVSRSELPGLLDEVADFRVWGPEHFRDEAWDLTFVKLRRRGVQIEIAEAEDARYFDADAGAWVSQNVSFEDFEPRSVLGVEIQVMPKGQLVAYKRALNRAVDRRDLAEMGTNRTT